MKSLKESSVRSTSYKLKLALDNQTAEIEQIIGLGWAAVGKLRSVFKSNMTNSLKRKVFYLCVLPLLIYGSETLTLTERALVNKMRVVGSRFILCFYCTNAMS